MNFKYKIALKSVPKGPSTNIPGLFQIMAWHRPGDKPLSETVTVTLLMHVCVTRPQWVNKDLSMVITCPIAKVVSSIYRHSKDYVALVSDTGVASAHDTFSLFIFVRDEKEIWFFWLISVHKKLHFIKKSSGVSTQIYYWDLATHLMIYVRPENIYITYHNTTTTEVSETVRLEAL